MMSIPAPFSSNFDDRPVTTTMIRNPTQRSLVNEFYIGHIYGQMSTIPNEYLYWFSPAPNKSLTVTGESKAQVLQRFKNAVLQTRLETASTAGRV